MGILIGVFAVLIIGLAIKSTLGNAVNAQQLPDGDDDDSSTSPFQVGPLSNRGACDITWLGDGMPDFDDDPL